MRADLFLDCPFLGAATVDVDSRNIRRGQLGGVGEVRSVGGGKLDDDGVVEKVGAELALARVLAGGEDVGEDHGCVDDIAVVPTTRNCIMFSYFLKSTAVVGSHT